jgi:diaminohydroxyphosphoribosylaminopyrimidine deaminase / 5-amino-6-(5-phosphoribosylamino)uracil reductase
MTGEATTLDRQRLAAAIDLSRRCPGSTTAFSVGALLVAADGTDLSHGYSRETDTHDHAEEIALAKLEATARQRLTDATLYTSLEPCSIRKSRPQTCTSLILDARIPRVVFAWREPSLLVDDCQGAELLDSAGVEIIEVPDLAPQVREINWHLLERHGT